jgi:farnesyl-diphosphate farnesyltransferase
LHAGPEGASATALRGSLKDSAWRARLQGTALSPAEASEFAAFALDRVSRTFALNIRALPEPLRGQVLHAYLYCRMADTLEDDAGLPAPEKATLLRVFATLFDPELPPHLRTAMAKAFPTVLPETWKGAEDWEKILVARTPLMLEAFTRFPDAPRSAVGKCVTVMCGGMADFSMRQQSIATAGTGALIESVEDLDRYCWFVAGTVGEMLCDLFIDHARIPEPRAAKMRALGVSFGTGLQLVNILKDVAEDRSRGVSWLPGTLVAAEGVAGAQRTLQAKALRHLEEALAYTLTIPRLQRGIRLFCLWPLLMAVETLALLVENAGAADDSRRKITRAQVAGIITSTRLLWWADGRIRAQFERAARRVRAALHESTPAHTFGTP